MRVGKSKQFSAKNKAARDPAAPRPRGRPRTLDPTALLARAVEVFWERGYDGASLDDLVRAMGVSRPTLYSAFGDKRSVFLAAIDAYAEGIGAEPMAAFEAEADIVAAVRAFLRVSLENNTAKEHPWGCLIGCCASTSAIAVPGVAGRVSAIGARTERTLRARFEDERAAGTLADAPSPAERAALLSDLMNAQALRARMGTSRRGLLGGLDARVRAVTGPLPAPPFP